MALHLLEAHWAYYDAAGGGYRPIALEINRSNGGYLTSSPMALTASALNYFAMDGNRYVRFSAGALDLFFTTALRHNVNNTAVVRQLNAAGNNYNALIYTDSSDNVVFGEAAANGTSHFRFQSVSSTPRIGVGGLTSSFPAIKRNATVLETKLGDDSAYTTHAALTFQTMTALVALGGGAAPTLGTIGGSGPATAAQNSWMRMIDSTGAACWVPVWK